MVLTESPDHRVLQVLMVLSAHKDCKGLLALLVPPVLAEEQLVLQARAV